MWKDKRKMQKTAKEKIKKTTREKKANEYRKGK